MRNETDKDNYPCGIFSDFQKTSGILDHLILLEKLEYYGVKGIPNKSLVSYLSISESKLFS